jgi:membrane protein DedA with SNARE-associated domain
MAGGSVREQIVNVTVAIAGMLIGCAVSYCFARWGEPQAAWLWHSVLGAM